MKQKIKERIIESGGRIVDEKIHYLKAVFPESKEVKSLSFIYHFFERKKCESDRVKTIL
jgi:hypothetical protein